MSNLMIECGRCRAKISPDAASCPQCGEPQAIGDRGRRVRCEACRTDNAEYLEACRGCGRDLSAERAFRDACEHNSAAGHKRAQFAFWGAWSGAFPGLIVAYLVVGKPDESFGRLVGGLLVVAVCCGVTWLASQPLAAWLFPYRFPATLPDEKQRQLRNLYRD